MDIARHALFLTLAGSHAHGTARPGSDLDVRGVVLAPLRARLSLWDRFEHAEGPLTDDLLALIEPALAQHDTARAALANKGEFAVDELAKFFALCAVANPSALEVLFTDERHWLHATPRWRRLYAERRRFLTRKVAQTFNGYAQAQLQRIESHRAWLLSPPRAKPTRATFGLPEQGALIDRDQHNRLEQSLAEKLRSYQIDELEMPRDTRIALQERLHGLFADVLGGENLSDAARVDERLREVAARALGLPAELIAALNAEKRYRAAMRHWESYQSWLTHRNPARAELERRFGYDTKHAMHLVRLMRMGLEALERGELTVHRPDADELRAIREGALRYEALLAMADTIREQIAAAARHTSLPVDIDRAALDELFFELAAE